LRVSSPAILAELAKGQRRMRPSSGAAIFRVPPELIFDAGFGELFIVRVAGNVISPEVMGTLQYAGVHLRTPLFVVLGQEGCGAINAAARPSGQTPSGPRSSPFVTSAVGQPDPPMSNARIHSLVAALRTCRPRASLSVGLAPRSSNSLMMAVCCWRACSEPLPPRPVV
jgi:hypothetical protein